MAGILTFLAVAFLIFAGYSVYSDIFTKDQSLVSARLAEEMRQETRRKVRQSKLFKDGGLDIDKPPDMLTYNERLDLMLAQSGKDLTVKAFLTYVGYSSMAGLTVTVLVMVLFFGGSLLPTILLATMAAMLFAYLPFSYIKRIGRKRRQKMFGQLPDTFDLMARVIRAGQTMSQAMNSVAGQFDEPIALEMAICAEQQNLGLAVEDAMRDLARRSGLIELQIFAMAMIVQRQTGGNMAALLENLAELVRERFRIRSLIQTLTAESRIQAYFLLGLPPGLMLVFTVIKFSYMKVLFYPPGIWLLVMTGASEFLGWLVISKMIEFDS